jgi:pimeloyl-ACP methyl ester carboxylesterase
MPIMPFDIVWIWLRGLLSIAILAGAGYFLRSWYQDSYDWVPDRVEVVEDRPAGDLPAKSGRWVWSFEPGRNRATAELAAALGLLAWGLAGRPILKGFYKLTLKPGADDPMTTRGGEVRRLKRPDGSELHVEMYGPHDAPPIVLTHGWGANATEWYYEKERLAGRFRLIVWDLPGLGLSKKPDNNDYSLENLARHLDAVLDLAGNRPAILLGHSIGGMITLTFCRLFPQALGQRVAGLTLVHTTCTNPVRTTQMAAIKTALEKPLLVPLLHLTIGLWPLVWLMNWLSYLNGSFHRSTHKSAFAGTETRGQLDFAARFLPHDRPDVLARGMFGMLHYDATATLATIPVPALIVAADKDVTCLPEASEVMNREIPGSTLVVLAPARHMGLVERNDRFDAVVAEFADACLAAKARVATVG